MPSAVPVAIALGSNLGDRHAFLSFGISRLHEVLSDIRASSFHDTEAVGVGPQPRFLNAALIGSTTLSARALLERLLAIELEAGRVRPFSDAPRTLDLDLILFGDAIVDEPGLQIPHPRFRDRSFVLDPLAEIAPEWTDPVTGKTIGQLRTRSRHP